MEIDETMNLIWQEFWGFRRTHRQGTGHDFGDAAAELAAPRRDIVSPLTTSA
jgi:hypothetical protein